MDLRSAHDLDTFALAAILGFPLRPDDDQNRRIPAAAAPREARAAQRQAEEIASTDTDDREPTEPSQQGLEAL